MVFVWVPLLAVGLSRMFKVDWTAECCIHAASLPLSHGIGHIACLFKGCCSGYAASWGVYNPRCDGITFPIQLIESLASLTIAIILMVRTYKNNYVASEKEYPLMLVMYGGVRFVLEFFRDNEKIVLGCSGLAFHALFMLLVGIVWLVRIKKKAEEEAAPVLPVLKGRRK